MKLEVNEWLINAKKSDENWDAKFHVRAQIVKFVANELFVHRYVQTVS